MARVAVLIDRAPDDPEWKGAAAWALIDALAESQHDVQVFTPLDPARLGPTHPRVGVARPASSFHVTTMVTWGRALVQYRPDILHTFAPRPARFPKLTIWPYLEGLGPVLARTRRVATLFDAADARADHAAARWLFGHPRWSAFHRDVALAGDYRGAIDELAIDDVVPPPAAPGAVESDADEILIPAPVSEWAAVDVAWPALGAYLREDPTRRVRILGGWGDLSLRERRRAWTALADFTARVQLAEPLSLAEFVRDAAGARDVWMAGLARDSWRARVAEKVRVGPARSGDTVNQLSRIYSAPGRW